MVIAVPLIVMKDRYIQSSFNFCSIIKQSGAAISSRLIPPKVPPIFFIVSIIDCGLLLSISISIESISANLLNVPHLIDHRFNANEPNSNPNIADPLLITATKLPLLV